MSVLIRYGCKEREKKNVTNWKEGRKRKGTTGEIMRRKEGRKRKGGKGEIKTRKKGRRGRKGEIIKRRKE